MVMNYMFMIATRSKSAEEVIKAYLTGVYSTFRGNQYIPSDRESEFTSKQFTWLPNRLGLTKVYTSPYTPTGNSAIEWKNTFLKASLRKLICNHPIDWDEMAHKTTIAYNVISIYLSKLHSI